MKKSVIAALFASSLVFPSITLADEVTDAAAEAIQLYKDGKLNEAAGQLDYASTLIRQQRAESIKQFFPDALDGWKAADVESNATPSGMMGGVVSASRQYRKNQASVELSLAADSPMLQSVMMMFSNPAYATMGGGKLTKIKDEKAIIKNMNGNIEITIALAGKILVTLQGSDGATEEDLRAYAEALDMKKLAEF